AGIESFLMTLYRKIDRNIVQFDFLVHREEKGFFDEEILQLGGEIHRITPLVPRNLIKYFLVLRSFFKQNRSYNIVHCHLNATSAIVLGIARLSGVKHRIAHSHIDQIGGNNSFFKKILRPVVNYVATERFACSKAAGEWLYGSKH